MAKSKSNFRRMAKFLCLAQIASTAEKRDDYAKHAPQAAQSAACGGYSVKNHYIHQAIAAGKLCSNVRVSQRWEKRPNGPKMNVIYFDIVGMGQVSFHSNRKFRNIPKDGEWNGIIGGPMKVCQRLDKKLKLQLF